MGQDDLLRETAKKLGYIRLGTVLGQSTTGKKDALVWRVANNADDSLIARYCSEKLYMLSETGQVFLREHNDYVMIHKHKNWGIGWKEYDSHKIPGRDYYDTMWGIFNEQLAKNHRILADASICSCSAIERRR